MPKIATARVAGTAFIERDTYYRCPVRGQQCCLTPLPHECLSDVWLAAVCTLLVTKAHISPFHLKEISGFFFSYKGKTNLDSANKARLLPSLSSLPHIHPHICMLFEEVAVLIQKPKL